MVGYQRWEDLLFLHWRVPPASIRALVDRRLELDLLGGNAFVSLTPFTMRAARLRLLPRLPTLSDFHELNLRTYVRAGGVPGLWFFSLDAASATAAALARVTLGLPYFRARMWRSASGRVHEYRSERLAPGPVPATFDATWTIEGPARESSLARFLAERYAFYSALGDFLLRMRVRHRPWVLTDVRVEEVEETVTRAAGITVTGGPVLAQFSAGVDVEVLAPEPVANRER